MNEPVLLLEIQHGTIAIIVSKVIAALCAGFLGITFSQSAYDKISDFKGNKEYLGTQFAKTPFRSMIGALLPVLIFLELNSALACFAGILIGVFKHNIMLLAYGLFSSAVALLCLLFGQRIAKDYAGAASITGYFIIAIAGLIAVVFSQWCESAMTPPW